MPDAKDGFWRNRPLGPGEYSSQRAMGMNERASSVPELGWTPDGSGGWSGGGNRGSGSRAVL